MQRRAVVVGTLLALTAGCTDRLHDVAASTPGDIDVRSRFVDGDPLAEPASIADRSTEAPTHLLSFRSAARAADALGSDAAALRADEDGPGSFVAGTAFVDDGGESILLVVQRVTSPALDLRLSGVSRTGRRSLRVAVDEVGTRNEDDPVVKTLLVRLADGRATPERVTASVEGDRASVTI